jgi:hypothetical protein
MNLYAIKPSWSPDPVEMFILRDDAQALEDAVFIAAQDLLHEYGSPTAEVHKVTADGLVLVGTAYASDAPPEWEWAHPAVEDALNELEAEFAAEAYCDDPAWFRKDTASSKR